MVPPDSSFIPDFLNEFFTSEVTTAQAFSGELTFNDHLCGDSA